MSMPSKKGHSTGKPELTKILSASHRDAEILELPFDLFCGCRDIHLTYYRQGTH